jgi:hypothetical protein
MRARRAVEDFKIGVIHVIVDAFPPAAGRLFLM